MKKISDYILFYDSWQLRELNLKPGEEYLVVTDLGHIKKDNLVKFIGFDDVDNHYGIFVFTDSDGNVLEVSGDFSGSSSLKRLEAALSKP